MTLKKQISIDKKTAGRYLLAHHKLLEPRKRKGKKAIIDLIRHLNCIQFDTAGFNYSCRRLALIK